MRKIKQTVRVNDSKSLESLMQETYNDACGQIVEAQKVINEMTTGSEPEDVRDYTDIASQRTNALKIKDSAIKIKLELAKLQNEVLKHNSNIGNPIKEQSEGVATLNDFDTVRELLRRAKETPTLDTGYKL